MSKASVDTIGDALRAAVAADPRSLSELAADAGIDLAMLFRFATRERDLRVVSAGKLAAALGLALRPADGNALGSMKGKSTAGTGRGRTSRPRTDKNARRSAKKKGGTA